MTDEDREALLADSYFPLKELPDGRVLAVTPMLFTAALCVIVPGYYEHLQKYPGDNGRETRFCYPSAGQAIVALLDWDGNGDPPGDWVKQKGRGVDRLNPRLGLGLAEEDFEE